MKSIKSALDVLNCFTDDNREQGVSEISRQLGMHKSKVSRILSTLATGDLLVKSESNRKYRLGPKILRWAAILLSQTELRTLALPYMEELKRKTGETVNLFVLEGDCRICIERVESPQGIRMVSRIGEPIPLPAGAVGKLLLAYLPEKKRKELIKRVKLTHVTPKTITCKKELDNELQKIRKQGFAKSFQERVPLAGSLAAPIKNYTGEVIAALSIGGPVMRFTPQRVREYLISLKETAHQISRELGYQG
jgi:DNA-binding IclR family transcriptional regulator